MFGEIEYPEEPQVPYLHIDGLVLVAIALVLYMAFYVVGQLFSISGPAINLSTAYATDLNQGAASLTSDPAQVEDPVYAAAVWDEHFAGDPYAFSPPYQRYALTQGLHGQSYGHLAIDLAAGRGEAILSPINGTVAEVGTDQYGNTTLVIENEIYRVLMLHGDYTVNPGDAVNVGDQVGTESNHGYTMDMAGRLCHEAPGCGNHTHLNVFDKTRGANINPLELIGY